MKRILAIRTNDKEYAQELAKEFNRNEECIFQTVVLTDDSSFDEFFKGNRADVLLCDEELLDGLKEEYKNGLVFGLSEISSAGESIKEYGMIFKYQSSGKIMEEIMSRFMSLNPIAGVKERKRTVSKNVICVCSPVGGSFSSTYSLALAQYYAGRSSTLFLSFDPFFVLPGTEKDPAGKDLTDIIFYLNGMQPYLMEFIKGSTIKRGSLECISGVSHWFDLYDMSPENMHDLVDTVCKSGDYENIIFDLGIIGAAGMEVLLAAKRIYVPKRNDPGSIRKLKEWKRQLRFCGKAELIENIREIIVPEDIRLSSDYEFDDLLSGKVGRFIEESEGMKYY